MRREGGLEGELLPVSITHSENVETLLMLAASGLIMSMTCIV